LLRNNSFKFFILISVLALFLLVYHSFKSSIESEIEKPLIIVNGIIAPSLSKINGHKTYVSENNCMNCHITEVSSDEIKKIAAPLIPHMFRENCNSCHFIKE
tara:strand:+ start:247 stop:552 length:306 start_codon:yes stop_codon:yes gene_type:complete